jgi:hypothetical protein
MNDRTPVILPPELTGAWLDPELTGKHAALELITRIEHEPLQVRAVSTAVNKTGRGGSRGPELIEPIGEHGDQPRQLAPRLTRDPGRASGVSGVRSASSVMAASSCANSAQPLGLGR